MSILTNLFTSKRIEEIRKQYAMKFSKQISTNYYITQPSKKTATLAMANKTVTGMMKSGIVMGKCFAITDIPYICYTSRTDHQINLADFKGRIRFGEFVHLHSGLVYPFPNGPVHLSIIKTAPDRIGMITIGDNVILPGTTIISYGSVTIGNNVLLGPQITIMDCDGHPLKRGDEECDELEQLVIKPVEIKDNAWIGAGAVILKGVTIGENSIVGINSVVMHSVPDNTVVAGNPAWIV